MEIKYRPGKKKDSATLAELINMASDGVVEYLFHGLVPGMTPVQVIAHNHENDNYPHSYKSAIIATDNNDIVGMALSYPSSYHKITDEMKNFFPEDRLKHFSHFYSSRIENSWFLDALSVVESHRRRGIGRELISHTKEVAIENGYNSLSLMVLADNALAIRLYKDFGFKVAQKVELGKNKFIEHAGGCLLMKCQILNKKSGWQLSCDGPSAYEKYIVPAYTGAWAKEIVNRACLSQGEKILDVACGTGLVARTAADVLRNCDLIYGIDVNEEMIKKAYEIEKGINWQNCEVTDMTYSDNYFDVVFCQQGLQYFPDPSLALKQINRVLVKSGRILLSVWRPIQYSPFYESLCKALEKYLDIKAASMLLAAFSLGDYEKLKTLFEDAGFNSININIVIKQMSYSPFEEFVVGGMMATPFFQEIQAMPSSLREEMFSDIYDSNQDYIDDDGLAAPTECYIVNAKK